MEYLKRLNDLKDRNSKIEKPLKSKVDLHKTLTKEIEENAINGECSVDTIIDLSNNTKALFEIIDQHKKVSDDTLELLEVVCKKLENLEALAVYRDFISLLVLEVEKRLGNEAWVAVSIAINRKRKYKKMNFRDFEKETILKLEKVLSNVMISVEEFELLMALKDKSNCEFHKGEEKDVEEVRQQLETSLSSELQEFKGPLRKLFYALDIWDAL